MKVRGLILVTAVLIGVLSLGSCDFLYQTKETPDNGSGSEPPSLSDNAVIVRIVDFAFEPQEIEIEVGQTIAWVQEDSAPHTVTSTDPVDVLDSETLNQTEVYEFTFDTAGTYEYFCSIHPAMTGTVIVNEPSAPM